MGYRKFWFSPEEVHELNLRERSDSATDFISQRAYQSLRPDMDNVAWNEAFRNKLINILFFKQNGIGSAPFLGYLSEKDGIDSEGLPLRSAEELVNLMKRNDLEEVVVKHVFGGGGNGVFLITLFSDNPDKAFLLRNGGIVSFDWLNSMLSTESMRNASGYVVEAVVKVHADIDRISNGGLFSLRILSLRKKDNEIAIQGVMARFGRRDSMTDHSSRGAHMCKVDVNSGVTSNCLLFNPGATPTKVERHLDSQLLINGFTVPFLMEAQDLVCEAHKVFPGVNFVGWDVFIAQDGPILLEGNVGINTSITQSVLGGFGKIGILKTWAEELGCSPPDGSLAWRFNHYFRGRRLSALEMLAARAQSHLMKRRKA